MASHQQQPGRIRTGTQFAAITVGVVALAPVWLFVGYPLERSWTGPGRACGNRVTFRIARHPLAVALSTPMRLVAERLLGRSRRTPGGEGGPPTAGDRFPRRPKPTLPSDAIALSEPGSR
ncbi:hypothetical protein [Streptacidiphilus sp. MAP5-3]|uniref:hypothetical protein n=1 Tax=unclassified Streptacidiphilus TaxID=2643834 RepID=UPI0035157DEC